MPELPEVETVVRNLREPLIGHVVQDMWYDWENTIHSPVPDEFRARILGQTFRAVNRRAKYILAELDEDILVVHLKMTGRLYVTHAGASHDADRWVHFRLDLDSGKQLRFSDSRKFGKVYLVNDLEAFTTKLGPEPLDDSFTPEILQARLQGHQRNIKALLLDQSIIAGVGNIYADESLFRSGIHPCTPSNTITYTEVTRLHQAIQESLTMGIQHEGASISWYRKPDGTKGSSQNHFLVYGRDGEPCTNCGHIIEKIRVAQRGTHYCPICQAGGES